MIQRARRRPGHCSEVMSNGDGVLTTPIISSIANCFDVAPSSIENAELRHPLAA